MFVLRDLRNGGVFAEVSEHDSVMLEAELHQWFFALGQCHEVAEVSLSTRSA
jgi:hypothetical protein